MNNGKPAEKNIQYYLTKIRHLENELLLAKEESEYFLNKYREMYTNIEEKVRERSKIISDQNILLHREIEERRQVEKELKLAVKQKKFLLQEVHHRVKNNMQVISSLLNLQLRHIKDEKVSSILKDSQYRIRSMALVHEHIYNSDSLADVNMAEYLTTLTKNIFDSYRNNESYIRLEFKTEPVFTSLETSIPCGLVVNEVITNAMKYAFKPGTRDGIISVQIHEDEDHNVHLVLGDNGAGIDKNYIPDASKSLGTYLIQILIERQLKGTITRSSENGTVYTINFKNTSKINDIPQ